MKDRIIPIVSVVVGVLAFLLTIQYIKGKEASLRAERDEFNKSTEQMAVVTTSDNIPRGTTIKKTDLRPLSAFKQSLRSDVVTRDQAKLLIGRKTVFEIKRGEPIFWSDIEGGVPLSGTLATIIQHGMRAISLSIGGAPGVSGMLRPGDRIDLLGTFSFPAPGTAGEMESVTLTVLQDVTILATGQQLANDLSLRNSRSASGYNTITLEVTAEEAEVLVFAQNLKGRLYTSLRNNKDNQWKDKLPEVNFKYIENELPAMNRRRQTEILRKKL
jgi:pilus assembly protein CpaB